jgi:MFS family permease
MHEPRGATKLPVEVAGAGSEQEEVTAVPPPRRSAFWLNVDFLKLWGGETLSQIGTQVTVLALPLTAIITLHARPQQVGFLTAAQFAPWLIVTLFVGVWLDTHRRRPALLVANAGRFVLLGLIPLLDVLGGLSMPTLYVLAFLAGTLSAVFDVAYLVYLPSLVGKDELVQANARLESSYSVALIAGPGLGGALVQAFTAPFAILANAISYGIGALTVAWIRRPEPDPPRRVHETSMLAEIKHGLATTFRDPVLRALVLVSAWFNLFEQATLTLTLLYGVRRLDLPSGLLGAILATGAVGGVLGAVLAARIGRRLGVGRTLAFAIPLSSLGLVLVPVAHGSKAVAGAILVAAFLVYGFGSSAFNVHSVSIRVTIPPPELLARVMATYRFVMFGTIPLGALLGGFLGGELGLRRALVIVVAASVAGSVVFALGRIRKLTTPAAAAP